MQPIQGTCNCNHLKKNTNYSEEKVNLNNFLLHLDPQSEIRARSHDKKTFESIREDISGVDHNIRQQINKPNVTLDNFCM